MIAVPQKMKNALTLRNVAGALFFAIFFAIAVLKWEATGKIFFLLLSLRALFFAVFMLFRVPAEESATWYGNLLAYVATAIPLLYFSTGIKVSPVLSMVEQLLAIAGYSLALLATIELGTQIGIGPAKRGEPCRSGVYRWLNHPMYVGYAIAEFGWVLVDLHNLPIFLLSMGCQYWRAKMESVIIGDVLV